MLKKNAPIIRFFNKLINITLIILFFLSLLFIAEGHSTLSYEKFIAVFAKFKINITLSLLIWAGICESYRFYSSKRTIILLMELVEILKLSIISVIITSIVLFLLNPEEFNRYFLFIAWLSFLVPISIVKIITKSSLNIIRKSGYNYRNVLIVGANKRALDLGLKLENNSFGLNVIGYIDDQYENKSMECNIVGNIDQLKDILKNNIIDEVFVTLPIKSLYEKIKQIIFLCEKAGVKVKILSNMFQSNIAKSTLTYVGDIPVIDFYSGPNDDWKLILKRFLDILLSGLALFFFTPLFFIISLIIKITSKGPIFFEQERSGCNNRTFKIYKFRSMKLNAEELKKNLEHLNEMSGPIFKIKNDPRLTTVGKFLRKYSIDELPQLINVLKGDMSLVGPRPPLPSEVKKYDWEERRKLVMKPGITCIWQVSGRNNIPFKEWIKLDLKYIDNWSLTLDFMLLLKTIPVVLKGTGAH